MEAQLLWNLMPSLHGHCMPKLLQLHVDPILNLQHSGLNLHPSLPIGLLPAAQHHELHAVLLKLPVMHQHLDNVHKMQDRLHNNAPHPVLPQPHLQHLRHPVPSHLLPQFPHPTVLALCPSLLYLR